VRLLAEEMGEKGLKGERFFERTTIFSMFSGKEYLTFLKIKCIS
jgi:hypothetical protein